MHPGRFVWYAWGIGDPKTFKFLQCNEDPRKRNIVLHRVFIVLRSLTSTGYNSARVLNSDAYFPYVKV